jgi:tetratricopeptide (TPR) repeat protein
LLRQRQWGLAACVLERAVAADPISAEAQAWLGEALDRLERPAESLPHLERATVLAPDAPLGWLLLGMHRLRAGDTQAAREALLQAQRLDAGNPAPCLGMAAVLAAESRYTEVGRWTEAALERAPEDVEVWKAVARFYLERNLDPEKGALPAAEGATRLAPTDAEAWMLLGWARLLAQDVQQALAALDTATRLDDSLAYAHHLCGLALRALGREAEARQVLIRAEDLGYRERLSAGERQ